MTSRPRHLTVPVALATSALAAALCVSGPQALGEAASSPGVKSSAKHTRIYSVPRLFEAVLPVVKEGTDVPILLPNRIRSSVRRSKLFPEGKAQADGYDFFLGLAPRCGGGTACHYASFSGRSGRRVSRYKTRVVRLARGLRGRFKPLTCRASCAPPFIQWRVGGIRYEISFKDASPKRERKKMIGLANSAIRSGPR